ncbi:hypothetical protein SAMN05216354_1141 [Xylanibacter ruminicola]|uniref:Uncharacterized protein n=2 Tax=Bacteroidales TaxID=171549 RepID=A0A1H5TZ26_XYLRU|nr:hypothetical protein SAMN05216354_1141 [Xylanibacter ruminicola]SEV83206.1 hypothetical protein SAMN04487827_0323 [Prevotella sp. khp7]
MILTMVAMLSMTTAFAEDEKVAEVKNAEAYELNINCDKLAQTLKLDGFQKDAVENIHKTFASELMFAAHYGNSDRDSMVEKAIKNDVKSMRRVLDEDQMHTYLRLLNATINNRGLNK